MKTELLMMVNDVAKGFFERMADVLSSAWGRLCSLVVFLISWFTVWMGDARLTLLCLVLAAVIVDLIWGIVSSAKRHKFAMSIGFTKTVLKMVIYGTVMALSAIIEKSIGNDITLFSRAASSVLIVAETISIFGHILIVKPDAPLIKFLWKLLRSEIAKKLGVSVEDVEAFYDGINKEKEVKV